MESIVHRNKEDEDVWCANVPNAFHGLEWDYIIEQCQDSACVQADHSKEDISCSIGGSQLRM